jgi:kynurenine 3-monooxygenase
LEDVRIFQTLLKSSPSLGTALTSYTSQRHPSLLAIQRLAHNNYAEMASKTVSPLFLLRKRIDGLLAWALGEQAWAPLYTMVTFRPDLDYAEAEAREARQGRIVDWALKAGLAGLVAGASAGAWAVFKRRAGR